MNRITKRPKKVVIRRAIILAQKWDIITCPACGQTYLGHCPDGVTRFLCRCGQELIAVWQSEPLAELTYINSAGVVCCLACGTALGVSHANE
jgi:hypothetical protein